MLSHVSDKAEDFWIAYVFDQSAELHVPVPPLRCVLVRLIDSFSFFMFLFLFFNEDVIGKLPFVVYSL